MLRVNDRPPTLGGKRPVDVCDLVEERLARRTILTCPPEFLPVRDFADERPECADDHRAIISARLSSG
jgi:hypothetical protein